jgi:hypothetical protein
MMELLGEAGCERPHMAADKGAAAATDTDFQPVSWFADSLDSAILGRALLRPRALCARCDLVA